MHAMPSRHVAYSLFPTFIFFFSAAAAAAALFVQSLSIIFTNKTKVSFSFSRKMAGAKRGGRRGARKSVPVPHTSVRVDEEYSVHTRFGTVLSSPLRSPIRCVSTTPADHSSTSTPLIQRHSSPMPITNSNSSANYQSPTSSAAHNNDLATILQPQVDPHPSSPQYPDIECTTKFSPTNSRCYSNLGSANITECAQKLREEMEEDPEEEEVESAPEPGFVYVNEHTVKVENAPLVKSIFNKYGDITKGSDNKSPAILSLLLEHICVICNNLKENNFSNVSCRELQKRLDEVADLERQNMNVGCLREKIEYIIQGKVDLGRYLDVKEAKIEHDREISLLQQRLCVEKARSDEAEKFALDIKARVTYLKTHSLLHDLF